MRVLRLDAVLGIAVTGVVHWSLLRPIRTSRGASYVADKLLHVVVPLLAVGHRLAGVRPAGAARACGHRPALIWPIAYLLLILATGPIFELDGPLSSTSPSTASASCCSTPCGITVLFLAVAFAMAWADRRLPGANRDRTGPRPPRSVARPALPVARRLPVPLPTTDPTTDLESQQHHLPIPARSWPVRRPAAADGRLGRWRLVSREYLKSTFALRMKQLADVPDHPVVFGRLDYSDGMGNFHIGRRHVSDEHGDPMVIDWRAPVSLPFYRATRTDPMGVELRRRFGFEHGTADGVQGRGPDGRHRTRTTPRSSSRRSSGHASDRCATSSPRSSRAGRDRPVSTVAVDLREGRPGTARRRSASTARRTCCSHIASS